MKSVFAILSLSTLVFFAACDSDCSCEPVNASCQEGASNNIPEAKSSSDFTPVDTVPSSSSVIESSSAGIESSSSTLPESSSDDTKSSSSLVRSSSSINESSSASVSSSSAGFMEKCMDFSSMCRNCEGPFCPLPYRPCNECREEGMMAEDCVTGGVYKCENESWYLTQETQCMNVAQIPCKNDSTKCGRKICNSNAPWTMTDCESGDEYVCAGSYWTLMKKTESCTVIIGAGDRYESIRCNRSEAGTRTIDCARNIEYECQLGGYWQEINPTIGDTCLVEGSIVEGYIEKSDSTRDVTIFMCYEGKWEKYRGSFQSFNCVDVSIVRTPCDVNDAANEWIHQGDCDYQCRNGVYEFVPKLADE